MGAIRRKAMAEWLQWTGLGILVVVALAVVAIVAVDRWPGGK